MRETNMNHDPPMLLARLERRARRRLFLASWVPVFAAVALGTVIMLKVREEQQRLVALNTQLSTSEERLRGSEKAGLDLEARNAQLTTNLHAKEDELSALEAREQRLRQAVDSSDPQVAVAKIRAELGGRTSGERADALWRGGEDAREKNQPAVAEKMFLESEREDPTFAPAINGLGLLAADRGERLTAEKFYLRAISVDPKYRHGLYNLANLYFLMKKYDKASEYINRTLEVDPNYPGAAELMAKIAESKH